jgi:hypothetical protein
MMEPTAIHSDALSPRLRFGAGFVRSGAHKFLFAVN